MANRKGKGLATLGMLALLIGAAAGAHATADDGYTTYWPERRLYSVTYPSDWEARDIGTLHGQVEAFSCLQVLFRAGSLSVWVQEDVRYLSLLGAMDKQEFLPELLENLQSRYPGIELIDCGSVHAVDGREFLSLSGMFAKSSDTGSEIWRFCAFYGSHLFTIEFSFSFILPDDYGSGLRTEADRRALMEPILESFRALR